MVTMNASRPAKPKPNPSTWNLKLGPKCCIITLIVTITIIRVTVAAVILQMVRVRLVKGLGFIVIKDKIVTVADRCKPKRRAAARARGDQILGCNLDCWLECDTYGKYTESKELLQVLFNSNCQTRFRTMAAPNQARFHEYNCLPHAFYGLAGNKSICCTGNI